MKIIECHCGIKVGLSPRLDPDTSSYVARCPNCDSLHSFSDSSGNPSTIDEVDSNVDSRLRVTGEQGTAMDSSIEILQLNRSIAASMFAWGIFHVIFFLLLVFNFDYNANFEELGFVVIQVSIFILIGGMIGMTVSAYRQSQILWGTGVFGLAALIPGMGSLLLPVFWMIARQKFRAAGYSTGLIRLTRSDRIQLQSRMANVSDVSRVEDSRRTKLLAKAYNRCCGGVVATLLSSIFYYNSKRFSDIEGTSELANAVSDVIGAIGGLMLIVTAANLVGLHRILGGAFWKPLVFCAVVGSGGFVLALAVKNELAVRIAGIAFMVMILLLPVYGILLLRDARRALLRRGVKAGFLGVAARYLKDI